MNVLKLIFRWIGYCLIFFFVSTILSVVILKWLPVHYTPLMILRCVEKLSDDRSPSINHKWVPLENISHEMTMAVMAGEDNRYLDHNGFDFEEIYKARLEALHGGRERGASTISQQTAKNVFLWPGKSWLRKGLEAYFTVLIEYIWGKERIMEVYLNSIETADGVYGVEAIAKRDFHTTAAKLGTDQAALIAATLPNPRERDAANPTKYLLKRQAQIVDLMGKIKDPGWGATTRESKAPPPKTKTKKRK